MTVTDREGGIGHGGANMLGLLLGYISGDIMTCQGLFAAYSGGLVMLARAEGYRQDSAVHSAETRPRSSISAIMSESKITRLFSLYLLN